MKRLARHTLIAGFAVAALGVLAPSASAQDYPGTTAAPAPAACTATVSSSAPMLPNASVVVSGTCNLLTAGTVVHGTLNSTPIDLKTTTVVGSTASFPVTLPANWDTKAFHTLTITNNASGRLLLNGQIYVDSAGKITAPPASTPLPRTGSSHTADLSKAGIVLLAAGAAATLVARKRRRPATVAS